MNRERSEAGNHKPETRKRYAKEKKADYRIKLNIFGRQPVLEALRSDIKIEEVWLTDGLQGHSIRQIKDLIAKKEITVQTTRKDNIQKIVGAVVHQGIAATVALEAIQNEQKFMEFLQSRENPLLLILDQVQDPHNLGAILRTAEISGVDAVIMPYKGSADITATVAKTSVGALFHIPIYRSENLPETFNNLKSMNIKIFATLPRTELSMYQVNFKQACAILVGNEGQGVRKNLLPYSDDALHIPQFGKVQSLNASVSTAVVLYEALRQRHF